MSQVILSFTNPFPRLNFFHISLNRTNFPTLVTFICNCNSRYKHSNALTNTLLLLVLPGVVNRTNFLSNSVHGLSLISSAIERNRTHKNRSIEHNRACLVNHFFDLWQRCTFSGIEALEFSCLYSSV